MDMMTRSGGATALAGRQAEIGALWRALRARAMLAPAISVLFGEDPHRAEDFSCEDEGFLLDFSKTHIDRPALGLLFDLAERMELAARRAALFAGEPVNLSEGRPALHMALRAGPQADYAVDGRPVMPAILAERARVARFAEDVRTGRFRGADGRPIRAVVNVGIGGSDLGPRMLCRALGAFADGPEIRFLANIDDGAFNEAFQGLDPAETLVLVSSKSFTTPETLDNARAAKAWLRSGMAAERISGHLVALTSRPEKAAAFGVSAGQIFTYGDYVGGRYSVWGPVGLPLMLAIGAERFGEFLAGGAAMDRHFRTAPMERNLPVLLALTGIWHGSACGHPSRAVIPYSERMRLFASHLQQLEMESNGKGVSAEGAPLEAHSGMAVWGDRGTSAQHAFFQLFHQGTHVIPVEFIVPVAPEADRVRDCDCHNKLLANAFAQAEVLAFGSDDAELRRRLEAEGVPAHRIEQEIAWRRCPGNRPSVMLLMERLDPEMMGRLLALWEHRVFVEAMLLGINPFDQWGVEHGKKIAEALFPFLDEEAPDEDRLAALDPSTRRLIRASRRWLGKGMPAGS